MYIRCVMYILLYMHILVCMFFFYMSNDYLIINKLVVCSFLVCSDLKNSKTIAYRTVANYECLYIR